MFSKICNELNPGKLKRSELFFILFGAIMFFGKGQGWYDGMWSFRICMGLAFLCWCCKMLLTPLTLKEFIEDGILIFIAFIAGAISGEKGFFFNMLALTGMKHIDTHKAFKVWLPVFAGSYILMYVFSAIGIYDVSVNMAYKYSWVVPKFTFGYFVSSVLHMAYLVILMMIIFLYHDKLQKKHYIILSVINLIIFFLAWSRIYVAACFMLLIISAVFERHPKTHIKSTPFLLPAFAVTAFVLPLLPNIGGLWDKLNFLLSARLVYAREYLLSGKFTLFGMHVDKTFNPDGSRYFFIDSSYIATLAHYGIIAFIIVMIVYEVCLIEMNRKGYMIEMWLTLFILVVTMEDPFLMDGSFKNISIFFVGQVFYEMGGIRIPVSAIDRALDGKTLNFLSKYDR